jgi:hypothetical protein
MGNLGRERTLNGVPRRLCWPGMSSDVGHKLSNCRRRVFVKTRTNIRAPLVSVKTTQPLEMSCIDFLSLATSRSGYENICHDWSLLRHFQLCGSLWGSSASPMS